MENQLSEVLEIQVSSKQDCHRVGKPERAKPNRQMGGGWATKQGRGRVPDGRGTYHRDFELKTA